MHVYVGIIYVGIGLCVLCMLEIFPGGREPEVEGYDSCVVSRVSDHMHLCLCMCET